MNLRLKALGVWWLVCVIVIFIVRNIYSIFLSGVPYASESIAADFLFAIAAAVPLDVFLYIFVLPHLNKQSAVFKKIYDDIAQNGGVTEASVQELEKQYSWCAAHMDIYSSYYNSYAITLAGAHGVRGEFDKAYRYIDSVNEKALFEFSDTEAFQEEIIRYCVTRLDIACDAKDYERAEQELEKLKAYSQKYGTASANAKFMVDCAMADYAYLHGHYDVCDSYLEKYLTDEKFPNKFPLLLTLADSYIMQKRFEEADVLIKEAERLAQTDIMKEILDRVLKKR